MENLVLDAVEQAFNRRLADKPGDKTRIMLYNIPSIYPFYLELKLTIIYFSAEFILHP